MIGQTLGSYRIVEQIGEGGMATIFKGYDASMDRYVAVKILPRHFADSPEFVERFKREAQAIAKLEHPHIVPIHAYGEEDGTTYLIMRYMPTGTLSDRIRQGALPLDLAGHILEQIGTALDYAHSKGILHRDIKPSNILLDESNNAYLTDFGIAKMTEATIDLTTSGGILGTPAYMSPEQCTGIAQLTPATDQYALGIVAYEMVTGRTPFRAETPLAVINMHVNDPLPMPRNLRPDLPERAEQVILKALSKNPIDRYVSCETFANAFRGAVEGTVDPAGDPTSTVTRDGWSTPAVATPRPVGPPSDPTPAEPHQTDPYALPAAKPRKKMSGWLIAAIVVGVLVIGSGLCVVAGALGIAGLGFGSPTATPFQAIINSPVPTTVAEVATDVPPTDAPPTEAPAPTDAPPVGPAAGEVLYTDDFSNMNSGWEIGDYDTGSVYYENGSYVVTSDSDDQIMWGLGGLSFSDISLTVEATQISAGPNDDNAYGAGCRIQSDDDGYYLMISGDGYYSIVKADGGEFNYLVDWATSSAINQGNATNEIEIVCSGSELSLYVNGSFMASAIDSQFQSGDITLSAATFEPETTEVHFDNLVVRVP